MAARDAGAGEPGNMDTHEVPLNFEEDLVKGTSNTPDSKFDVIIGHIEDIIMEEEFQELQDDFMEQHYREFDDNEENKLIYTEIHRQYIDLLENFLLTNLKERMDDFVMEEFQQELVKRKEELNGEVFEMLLTFSDFLAFKEMFIDYKRSKEGGALDFSQDLVVRSLKQAPPPSNGHPAAAAVVQPIDFTLSPMQLPTKTRATDASCVNIGDSDEQQLYSGVHSLSISGESVLISTPTLSSQVNGNGASKTSNGEAMQTSPRPDAMDHL